MTKSLYEIFDIPKNASQEDIKKKFKVLIKKYHPDLAPEGKREEYEKISMDINKAYQILSDPEKRKMYDITGSTENMGGADFSSPFGGGNPFGDFGFGFDFANKKQKQKAEDIEITEKVTLEQIYTGCQIKKNINRNNLCKDCDGTGNQDKKSSKCEACKGNGSVVEVIRQGMAIYQTTKTCDKCKGSGESVNPKNKCKKCNGNKSTKESFELVFFIKKGTMDEEIIILPDLGNESYDKSRSNVIVHIKVVEHKTFSRKKYNKDSREYNPLNLFTNISLKLEDAICGVNTTITHLDNRKIPIQINKFINNGDIYIIKNEGLVGKDSDKGDLYITFLIEEPTLTEEQKNSIYNTITGNKRNIVNAKSTLTKSKSNIIDLDEREYDEYVNRVNSSKFRKSKRSQQGEEQTCVHQ